MSIAPGSSPSGDSFAISSRISIAVVIAPAGVTGVLPRDGAAVPAHLAGNLGLIESLLLQVRDYIPLVGGKLLILHHDLSLLAGRKNRGVSQITSTNKYREIRVALSI